MGIPVVITETEATIAFQKKFRTIVLAKDDPTSFFEKIMWVKENYESIKDETRKSIPAALELTQERISVKIVELIDI
ncbi:MAG: hypothetical protein HF967_03135 [Methanosarcinales archaeon]|nr:hypothetical protein [Methanosarcinales archaeon]